MFLILELESSIFENTRKFFWGRFFFIFWGLDWDVHQVVLYYTTCREFVTFNKLSNRSRS